MALSSVSVVSNSLLLKRWKPTEVLQIVNRRREWKPQHQNRRHDLRRLCQKCHNVLTALPGMQKAEVDLGSATATVIFDPARLDRVKISSAIEEAGYEATSP